MRGMSTTVRFMDEGDALTKELLEKVYQSCLNSQQRALYGKSFYSQIKEDKKSVSIVESDIKVRLFQKVNVDLKNVEDKIKKVQELLK